MKYINVEDVLDILNQIEDAQENGENFLSAARAMVEEQSFDPADYNFNEWCHDCKEYDQERHCCPRFNSVIRKPYKSAEKATTSSTVKSVNTITISATSASVTTFLTMRDTLMY